MRRWTPRRRTSSPGWPVRWRRTATPPCAADLTRRQPLRRPAPSGVGGTAPGRAPGRRSPGLVVVPPVYRRQRHQPPVVQPAIEPIRAMTRAQAAVEHPVLPSAVLAELQEVGADADLVGVAQPPLVQHLKRPSGGR